jgi:hypothetical protein
LPAAVVVANRPDSVSPLSSFESRSEPFSVPFFDILEESRRAGNRNGYNHSSAAGDETRCHAFERRDSSL